MSTELGKGISRFADRLDAQAVVGVRRSTAPASINLSLAEHVAAVVLRKAATLFVRPAREAPVVPAASRTPRHV